MSEERIEPTLIDLGEYKFGFHDENVELVASTGKGLNEEVIREMSRIKDEPEWMLEIPLEILRNLQENAYADLGSRFIRTRF